MEKEILMLRIEVLDLMHLAKYALCDIATESDKRIYERQASRVKSILDSYYNAVDQDKVKI